MRHSKAVNNNEMLKHLKIVATKIAVFWDVAPYCLVYTRRRFRETCCLFISV